MSIHHMICIVVCLNSHVRHLQQSTKEPKHSQALQQAQHSAAQAAEELAQSQRELRQTREAAQSAVDVQKVLEQKRTQLQEIAGKHRLCS